MTGESWLARAARHEQRSQTAFRLTLLATVWFVVTAAVTLFATVPLWLIFPPALAVAAGASVTVLATRAHDECLRRAEGDR